MTSADDVLDPHVTNVNMPYLSESTPGDDAFRCRRDRAQEFFRADAQVMHHAEGAHLHARAFRNAVHFGLSSGQRRNLLRQTPRVHASVNELHHAPSRATSGPVTPGVVCVRDCSYDALLLLTLVAQPRPRRYT